MQTHLNASTSSLWHSSVLMRQWPPQPVGSVGSWGCLQVGTSSPLSATHTSPDTHSSQWRYEGRDRSAPTITENVKILVLWKLTSVFIWVLSLCRNDLPFTTLMFSPSSRQSNCQIGKDCSIYVIANGRWERKMDCLLRGSILCLTFLLILLKNRTEIYAA